LKVFNPFLSGSICSDHLKHFKVESPSQPWQMKALIHTGSISVTHAAQKVAFVSQLILDKSCMHIHDKKHKEIRKTLTDQNLQFIK